MLKPILSHLHLCELHNSLASYLYVHLHEGNQTIKKYEQQKNKQRLWFKVYSTHTYTQIKLEEII